MEGFKIRCQTCGQVLYETTANYNCLKPLTGDMLRLLPPYKDWPTYDGALATESTPRFLMFCSQCAGYISTTGKLTFVDFPDVRVTLVSRERSMILCDEELDEALAALSSAMQKRMAKDELHELNPVDELQKMTPNPMTPEELDKKIEEQARPKRSKKSKRK